MNQNDQIEIRPITEERISIPVPLHKLWNAYRDWRVRKREESHARYAETVQDYVQGD